jgi:hypothetical protein
MEIELRMIIIDEIEINLKYPSEKDCDLSLLNEINNLLEVKGFTIVP